jgi:predicted nucleic acid-binding Zn ribbon protein
MAKRDAGGRDQVKLAREALAAARADAAAKGLRPSRAGGVGSAGRGLAADGSRTVDPDGAAGPADSAGMPGAGDLPGASGVPGARGLQGNLPAERQESGLARPGVSGLPGSPSGSAVPGARRQPLRRVRRDDPQALGAAIEGLLDAEGWNLAAATGALFGRWAHIVGPDLAGHTQPESLRDGELTVLADSTAWATQLRLLAAQLIHRLNVELGPGAVQRVKVRGPVAPPRKPGEWRVRGSRGPRDTYG